MTAVSGLLISWEMPAASEPTAASRRARRTWSWAAFRAAVRSSTRRSSSAFQERISSSRRVTSRAMWSNASANSPSSSRRGAGIGVC